ncbi:hypothetical protein Ancab_019674 [Ancistrocladus abbreviatus]
MAGTGIGMLVSSCGKKENECGGLAIWHCFAVVGLLNLHMNTCQKNLDHYAKVEDGRCEMPVRSRGRWVNKWSPAEFGGERGRRYVRRQAAVANGGNLVKYTSLCVAFCGPPLTSSTFHFPPTSRPRCFSSTSIGHIPLLSLNLE